MQFPLLLPLFVGGIGQDTACDRTSVTAEQIDRAVSSECLFDKCFDLRLVGHIGSDTFTADLGGYLGYTIGVEIRDHDGASALGQKGSGQRLADTSGAAGDYCNLVLEFHLPTLCRAATPG